MKTKALKLLRILNDSQNWTTAGQLSVKACLSVRSVKNYISEINSVVPFTIISSKNGYRIDKANAELCIKKSESSVSQGAEERVIHIITKLIKSKVPMDLYDFADELYVSLSTLKSDLPKIRSRIQPFSLELVHISETLQINGLEKNKRKMLSSLLYAETNESFMNIDVIQNAFPDIDIEFIKTVIMDIFNEYHVFINDFSQISLILHISIAVDRIRTQAIYSIPATDMVFGHAHAYQLAQRIVAKLELRFHITYNENEIEDLTLLLASCATTLDYRNVSYANLEEVVGKETYELVVKLVQEINAYYYINLSDSEFITRFALHIKNLLVRSRNNLFTKNPLTNSIKSSCPLLYETAVVMTKYIREQTGIIINDDEIAYIAFHLGGALETQHNLSDRVACVLYCPNYYDLDVRLTDFISKNFHEQLVITNIVTSETDLISIDNADLVLSTIPLSVTSLSVPVLNVSLFPNSKDINAIFKRIENIKKEKKSRLFEDHLRKILNQRLFRRNVPFRSEHEAIEYMTSVMHSEGYVSDTFIDEIQERERMSSTAFNNLAIPHSMKMSAIKTGMFVIINETPTNWGNQQVNLIMMLSINRNDRNLFNEVFENLTMVLTENETMEKVLRCASYDEFIKTLVDRI